MQATNKTCPFCEEGKLVQMDNEDGKSFHLECDTCKSYVEDEMITGQSPIISLAGAKNSTKTNFMYFLLASIKENRELKRALKITNDDFVGGMHEIIYKEKMDEILSGKFLPVSAAGEIQTLIYRLIRKNKYLYLTLKDTAGEEFDNPVQIINSIPHILKSDGIMLLIDPMEFPKVRKMQNQLKTNNKFVFKSAKSVINNLYQAIKINRNNTTKKDPLPTEPTRKLDESSFGPPMDSDTWMKIVHSRVKADEINLEDQRIHIPLAVCIAKFDLVLDCINYHIPNQDYFFDYRDMYDETATGIQTIEEKANTLKEILYKLDTTIVDDIEHLFSNVSYFPVILAKPTAISNNTEFDLDDNFNFNKGVLTPLIWLLKELNYI